MHELFRRVRYLMNRRRFDEELANDMAFHREMAAREGGRPLGSTLRLREEARDAWGWTWIDRCGQDLRYAARMLRKSPGFTLTAVLMLAIGIGVNVTAFGVFNMVILRPLPVRDPDTLLRFKRRAPQSYASAVPYPEAAFVRAYTKTLSAVLALNETRLTSEGEEKPLRAHFVSANFFSELGAAPILGRLLDPARDEALDAEPIAILSHGFWRRHFGADPLVVGKTISLNGRPATVIGVASNAFSGLMMDAPDIWLPITQHAYFVNGSRLLTDFSAEGPGVRMWGRLQPGLTPKVAEEELRSLAAALRKQHPADIWDDERLTSESAGLAKIGDRAGRGSGTEPPNGIYPVLALVGTLALLILAVACGNLGSLLLARGVAREREIAIRVAVGAGSGRLIRQLFTESLLLALLGSAAGVGVGYLVLQSVMVLTAAPAWLDPTPDWRVWVFAVGLGFAAAIVFGLAPALQVARQRHRATTLRQCLIGAQVAASCVLLIVAGLLIRALDRAMATNPGFDYQQVLSIDPGLSTHGYSSGHARVYLDALQSRLRAVAGVESVSLASTPPLGGRKTVLRSDTTPRPVDIYVNHIDPQFFQTMKIPLLKGRNFMRGDTRAIIVGESFARLQWPAEDPLGKQFEGYTVIGIAGSARVVALQDPDAVEAYYLAEEADLPSMVVLVKASGPPEGLVPFVAAMARSVDPQIFPEVQLMKSSFERKLRETELSALAVTLLGISALLLACLGIVGLVAYAVSQRTKEIGIRIALGAKASHVLSSVLRQLSRPVVAGLLVGIGGAAALSQILRRELYGISHLDPIAYLSAIGIFLITVTIAALWPARRALRVDPLRALRCE
jgi:predicted permease